MAYVLKDGQGSLFKNKEKQEEMHADYTGSVLVGGVAYWLNAWLKTAKSGEKYMSLSAKPKQAKAAARPAPAKTADPDDDVPF